MIRFLAALLAGCCFTACTSALKEPDRQVPIAKASVLPLALTDDFSIQKVNNFHNDPREPALVQPTQNPMIAFERQRVNYGAVSGYDRQERYGLFFTIWWKAKISGPVTVRLEYRQQNLGSFVQAKELHYPDAKGAIVSKINVIGDEYNEDGRITAWRALLIQNNKIVGLRQSFLWN